jgi:hypothetical protein
MNRVLVRGDGVAAYCCVHLLQQAGIPVALERLNRPRLPAIMLTEAALALLADIFGQKELFRNLPRISTRTVLWGPAEAPVTLPHSAVVTSEKTLLASLHPAAADEECHNQPPWRVFASGPLPPECTEQRFGLRRARAAPVDLRSGDPGCWTESTDDGWLFLIGLGGTGWLLSSGAAAQAQLERSRLVAEQIQRLGEPGGEFLAHPRIVSPLAGKGAEEELWLACGTAALAFDPLCGDGTAHAVREAVLAVAVMRAIAGGAPASEVLAHYESRLLAGFQRHLAYCVNYYRTGGRSPWWSDELGALERGMDWCSGRSRQLPAFRYRLSGFSLEAVA